MVTQTAYQKERVTGFTDGIFAFAVTLLVLNLMDISIPAGKESLIPVFRENISALLTFAITFFIIARFWMAHNRLFALIREFDAGIIKLNNTLLFFITVFPFAASILGTHMDNRDAVILYAGCFAMVGILQFFIGRHAYLHHLLHESDTEERHFIKVFTSFTLSTPVVFIISIFVAFFSAGLAELLWIVLLFLKMGFRGYYENNRSAEAEINKL